MSREAFQRALTSMGRLTPDGSAILATVRDHAFGLVRSAKTDAEAWRAIEAMRIYQMMYSTTMSETDE